MLKLHTLLFGLLALNISLVFTNTLQAKELTQIGFEQYIVELKTEALTHGFTQSLIDNSFAKVKFHQRAVSADRKQPEKVETLDTYLPKRVPSWKVKKARTLYKKHKVVLTNIANFFTSPSAIFNFNSHCILM